jgi:aspartate/methionine/tyrosine aminotransferase
MRQAVLNLEESRIREVANAGMGRDDVLAFWFGESDEVTPDFIRQAAIESLQRGETFYSHNLGLPELRQAVSTYMSALHGPVESGRIAITSGGVNALMIAMQALVDAGDEVVAVTPVWPNLTAQPAILGARVLCCAQTGRRRMDAGSAKSVGSRHAGHQAAGHQRAQQPHRLDADPPEQQAMLDHCRPARAPGSWPTRCMSGCISRTDIGQRLRAELSGYRCQPDDRLVVVHSFSKSFLMTGWRLGWLVMPPDAGAAHVGKLMEFNTSCASVFTQRAGIVALQRTADVTPRVVAHLKACRDTLVPLLAAVPGVQVALPRGGMYAFFRVAGFDDSLATAKRLVVEAGLGLAPGVAFAPEARGWLRWCFASHDLNRLALGVDRLRTWLAAQRPANEQIGV